MADRDRDFRPEKGQEGNQNWDDKNQDKSSQNEPGGTSSRRTDEDTTSSGIGSKQRTKEDNVGPLQSDLEQKPSEKRIDRSNQTGPGLG